MVKSYLHMAIPKNIAIAMNEPYVVQNGVAATATVLIRRQTLLSNSASIHGKSAKKPHATLPTVFVIPMMDSRNEAELESIS